jgi:hypothetical protein
MVRLLGAIAGRVAQGLLPAAADPMRPVVVRIAVNLTDGNLLPIMEWNRN